MTLTKWDPFRDLVSLQDRMNRLFDESVRNVKPGDEALSSAIWSPASPKAPRQWSAGTSWATKATL